MFVTLDSHQLEVIKLHPTDWLHPHHLWFRRPVRTRILVVVDGFVSVLPNAGFGLGTMIETLKTPAYNWVRFDVDTAHRANGAGAEFKNFRFDQKKDDGSLLINDYDQIWLFGFDPGNDGGTDANIEAAATKMSEAELLVLTRWMNDRKGGVLAMGDHHYLGATMCWKIPRVRHMRRWTNAQDVPPIGGALEPDTHLRHDTNQPATPEEHAGVAVIPFDNQSDRTPQRLEVKRYFLGSSYGGTALNYEPHPILCSRKYGVIDVFPDHPHEGWVYEDNEVKVTASYAFSSGGDSETGTDFPVVGGHHEVPEVIAWATTTPNPPYKLAKGPSPKKRFGVLGVYDGHEARVGRVVVDSTWHHWFNENLIGFAGDADTTHYEKMQDFYRNVAVWLAPPGQQAAMLCTALWNASFSTQATQELGPKVGMFRSGLAAKDVLGRTASRCTIRKWIWSIILPDLVRFRRIRVPDPLCLTCPPFQLMEDAALGLLTEALLPLRARAHEGGFKEPETLDKVLDAALAQVRARAAQVVVERIRSELMRDGQQLQEQLNALRGEREGSSAE